MLRMPRFLGKLDAAPVSLFKSHRFKLLGKFSSVPSKS